MSNQTIQVGPYQLSSKLGQGGMAAVYRAVDSRGGQDVALKILLPQYYNDDAYLRRFAKEGLNTRRLRHPHIVQTFDVGAVDGYHYIAMELVSGGTLSSLLQNQNGPLPFQEAIKILSEIGTALDHAHGLGYIHRDIKLSNILRTADGRYMLTDFGVSKHLSTDYTLMTGVGESIGTPSYMSPEQARSERIVDHRSDLYSFGVLAYRLLTGGLPFQAKDPFELTHKIIFYEPVDPRRLNPHLPDHMAGAIMRMLAKNPTGRYNSCLEMVNTLMGVRVKQKGSFSPLNGIRRMLTKISAKVHSNIGLAQRLGPLLDFFERAPQEAASHRRQRPTPVPIPVNLQSKRLWFQQPAPIAFMTVGIGLVTVWLFSILT